MNGWYIAAIIFGALTAYCTYYGSVVQSRRSSEEQSSRLGAQLQSIGTDIQELRRKVDTPKDSAKLQEVDKKYQALAEEYFRSAKLRAAQEEARSAKQQVDEVRRSQQIESYFRFIENEITKLAAAYNNTAGETVLEIESNGFPENLFRPSQDGAAYILLKFKDHKYWGVRISLHSRRLLAIEFVRLISQDGSSNYKTMQITGDSILLIFDDDKFRVSLHEAISSTARANIADGISTSWQPLDNFEPLAADLARRIIEYGLLPL